MDKKEHEKLLEELDIARHDFLHALGNWQEDMERHKNIISETSNRVWFLIDKIKNGGLIKKDVEKEEKNKKG